MARLFIDGGLTQDGSRAVIRRRKTPNSDALHSNPVEIWDLETATALTTFGGDSLFYSCDVAPDDGTLVAGDASGRVHFLRVEDLEQTNVAER